MAKELPYFKFEPSEYLAQDIQDCSMEAQGVFINVCSLYWIRLGKLKYATALQRVCGGNENALQELIKNNVIKRNEDNIHISFLDEQLEYFAKISDKNSENAKSRWISSGRNANALRNKSERNARREEERREEERRENNIPAFSDFLNHAKSKIPNISDESVKLKYDSWIENGWKDGNGNQIKNWKSKLTNTVGYLKRDEPKYSNPII